MAAARSARRVAAGGLVACALLACAMLAAGCQTQVAGKGTIAAASSQATTTSAPGTPTSTASPTPTATPTADPTTTPPAPANTVPAAFAGTWTGRADQPGSVLPHWSAVLVLPQGRTAGTFAVATFCTGVATVLAATQTRLIAREVITSDPRDKCAASGIITVQRTAANRATMRWVDTDHPDNTATATLVRR